MSIMQIAFGVVIGMWLHYLINLFALLLANIGIRWLDKKFPTRETPARKPTP